MLRNALRLTRNGVFAAGAASAAGATYLYQTDEKTQRAFDFSARITPLCMDYMLHRAPAAELHEKHAPRLLADVLHMGGYYVKAAQTICGMGWLPDAYEKEFLEFTASIARNTSSLPNLGGGASRALASLP